MQFELRLARPSQEKKQIAVKNSKSPVIGRSLRKAGKIIKVCALWRLRRANNKGRALYSMTTNARCSRRRKPGLGKKINHRNTPRSSNHDNTDLFPMRLHVCALLPMSDQFPSAKFMISARLNPGLNYGMVPAWVRDGKLTRMLDKEVWYVGWVCR